jgi:hypothetical protein
VVACDNEPSAWDRKVQSGNLVVPVRHVPVVLIAEPGIQLQTGCNLPAVLHIEMAPNCTGVDRRTPKPNLSGGRVTQNKIGKRTAIGQSRFRRCPAGRKRENSAASVGIHGTESVLHQVTTELERMFSGVPGHVVVQLEIAVLSKSKQSRVTHGGELTAEGDLRVARIQ